LQQLPRKPPPSFSLIPDWLSTMWSIMANPFRQQAPLPPPDEEPPQAVGGTQDQWRSQQAFQSTFSGPVARAGALRGATTALSSAPPDSDVSFQQAVDELRVREQHLEQARSEVAGMRRSEDALLRAARVAAANAQVSKIEASAARKARADAERKSRTGADAERRACAVAAQAERQVQAVIGEAERQLEQARVAAAIEAARRRVELENVQAAAGEAQRKLEEARVVAAFEAKRRRTELERASTSEAAAWNRLYEVESRVRDLERPCVVQEEMICETVWQLKAEEAFKFVRDSLVNGGSDRHILCAPAVVQKLLDTCEHNQACMPGTWASESDHDDNIPVIVNWATTAMRLKFGNADAHACVAFTWLFQRGIKCSFYQWPVAQGSHFFVVVGPSTPYDNVPCSESWVCDPWGDFCCPFREVPQQLGLLFGSGLSLLTLQCRAVSLKENNTATCEAAVNELVQKQSNQLDAGHVFALPDLAGMLPFQQTNALKQMLF